MRNIEIYSFPFQKGNEVSTRLVVDRQEFNNPDNRLTQYVVNKPMEKWLKSYKRKLFVWRGFLYELALELNASDYTIAFNGTGDGFKVFAEEILLQRAELERDGRKINVELIFRERSDCRRAVKVMKDAYESLIHKEKTDNNYSQSDKIEMTKNSLSYVLGFTEVYGTLPGDSAEALEKMPLIKINREHPKLIAAVFGEDCKGDITAQASDLLKDRAFRKAIVLVPSALSMEDTVKAAEKIAAESGAGEGSVSVISYSGDPAEALEEGIYSVYMPDVITDAIKKYYETARAFDDYKTDSFIMESSRQIDELFE